MEQDSVGSSQVQILSMSISCCYQTKLGSTSPCAVKPIYQHRVGVMESKGTDTRKTNGSCSNTPNSPKGFSEVFLKVCGGVSQGM